MSAFYLVQRLTRRDNPGRKGFDSLFECQYMGASEFEWGAIPESLKRIRANRRLVVEEGEVTRQGISKPVFVLAPPALAPAVAPLLTKWMEDARPLGKESTYFPEHVTDTASKYQDADAWWSLTEDVMWSLSRPMTEDLVRAVSS